MVAARLTSVPGSSDVFVGGVVAYANEVKERELGVPAERAASGTAPSPPRWRRRWPRGARERLGADVAVSVTGVAGPGGGTAEKPVGLVYLHAAAPTALARVELRLPARPRHDPRAARRSRRSTSCGELLSQNRHEAA